MPQQRCLIKGGTIVSMDPSVGEITNGQLLIEGDTIVAIGEELDVADADVIDATGKIVFPGFVDTHRHLWETAMRGVIPSCRMADYPNLIGSIGGKVRPEDVYISNLAGALDALNAGITTILDWSHISNTPAHSDAAIRGLMDAGIRGVYAHSCPQTDHLAWWLNSDRKHPEDIRRIKAEYFSSDNPLLSLAMGTRAPGFANDDVVVSDWELARELGVGITVHVIHIGGRETGNCDHVLRLDELGLLGPDITFIHGNDLSPKELELVAESGGTLSISPYVEMLIGHGFPATGRCVEHGIRPSFSVDIAPGAPGDMFTQMRAALAADRVRALHEKKPGEDLLELSHQDMLEFATIEGARTVGLGDKTGSLSVGKAADIVLLDAERINVSPVQDAAGVIVSQADTSNVHTVFVNGTIVKKDGELCHPEAQSALEELKASRDFLLTGTAFEPALTA